MACAKRWETSWWLIEIPACPAPTMTASTTSSVTKSRARLASRHVIWPAADPRLFDGNRAELADRNGRRVQRQDSEVGQLARLERPDTILPVGAVGTADRVAAERRDDVDPKIGPTQDGSANGLPINGRLHGLEWTRERHRSIR